MSASIVPFSFESHTVRTIVDDAGQPWFVAKDVCGVLDFGNHRQALESHVDSDDVQRMDVIDALGRTQQTNFINESGLYALILGSRKSEAKKFKRWVTSEVLPSLRKTGSYTAPSALEEKPILSAARIVKQVSQALRSLGIERNAAAISANQLATRATGVNLLAEAGHTHLHADNQQSLAYTPTELGKMCGVSARRFNLHLADAGLQAKVGDKWNPLPAAEGHFEILDTGKRHSDGTPIKQVKWYQSVCDLVNFDGI